jgi:acetyl-CoA carboxylase carboxyl transferase subunit beta
MHLTFDQSSQPGQDAELELLDLTCPACGSDLIGDELFLSHRVCGKCNRHFSIGARERVSLLVDSGNFEELNSAFVAPESSVARDQFPSAERMAEHQHLQVIGEAVVSGTGRIGGVTTVVVSLDDHLVGSGLGALMTEKIILALEFARTHKHPVVLLCAGGTSSSQSGPLAFVQGGRLAAALAQLHLESIPVIGVLTHPMAGTVFGTLAAHSDLLYSEPGVMVSSGIPDGGGVPSALAWQSAAELFSQGWIDGVVDRSRLKGQIGAFVDLVTNPGVSRAGPARASTDSQAISARDALANLAHPDRPDAARFLAAFVPGFVELHGDRVAGDERSVVCGIGRFESMSIAIAVQRPSAATNGHGAALAARKIARLARLAGRLDLPIVLLVDAGDDHQHAAFSAESAFAISSLSLMLSLLPVPVIAIGTGRVAGPLATSLMTGDRQFLMSSAVYAAPINVIPGLGKFPSPRQARPAGQVIAGAGLLTARECERLGLIDGVIDEPRPGAHADPDGAIAAVRATLSLALAELTGTGRRRLLDTRHRRQRTLGQSTPEGLAAARSELWEIQEWQRSVGRSIDEWRLRWDQLKASQPRLSFQRPDINDLASRLRARRAELLERARPGDRSAE